MNIHIALVVYVICKKCGKTTRVPQGTDYVCKCGLINRGQ